MNLYLFRHGIAVDHLDPDCPRDEDRYLTPRGIERTRLAAQGLRAMEVQPDVILSSPLVRARQTAELAAEALGLDLGGIQLVEALRPGGDPAAVLSRVSKLGGVDVLCAGHAPSMDSILAAALGIPGAGVTTLKKAGAACLELDPRYGAGYLRWILEPKTLRMLGGGS